MADSAAVQSAMTEALKNTTNPITGAPVVAKDKNVKKPTSNKQIQAGTSDVSASAVESAKIINLISDLVRKQKIDRSKVDDVKKFNEVVSHVIITYGNVAESITKLNSMPHLKKNAFGGMSEMIDGLNKSLDGKAMDALQGSKGKVNEAGKMLKDFIKSGVVKNMGDCMKVVSETAQSMSKHGKMTKGEFKETTEKLDIIASFIDSYSRISKALKDIDANKADESKKIKGLEKSIESLDKLATVISKLNVSTKNMGKTSKNVKNFDKVIETVNAIIEKVRGLKAGPIFIFKVLLMGGVVAALSMVAAELTVLGIIGIGLTTAMPGLKTIEKAITAFASIVETVAASMKVKNLWGIAKSRMFMVWVISSLIKIVRGLNVLALAGMAAMQSLPGLSIILAVFKLYSAIVKTVRGIKTGLFFKIKAFFIIHSLKFVRKILKAIIRMSRIRGTKRAATRLMFIFFMVSLVGMIFVAISMAALGAIIFLAVAPIFVLAIIALGIVLKIISFIVRIAARPTAALAFLLLAVMLGGLLFVAKELLILGIVAPFILALALPILGMFLMFIVVTLLILLISLIVGNPIVATVLIAGTLGMMVVAIFILVMLLIAWMLALIQDIKLDYEKIKDNVKKIIGTVLFIFECLFDEELNDPASRESRFMKIINLIGGIVAKFIMAVGASFILVFAAISVAAILLMAWMLRLVQMINLDHGKIKNNVSMIVETVLMIMDILFRDLASSFSFIDNTDKKGILGCLINFLSPHLQLVVEAIMATATMVIMTVSILSILLVAWMLRLIQMINLDQSRIRQNVQYIFDIFRMILKVLFDSKAFEDFFTEFDNGGLFGGLLNFVSPHIYKIWQAVCAIATIAVMTVVIALILVIAGMLRLLQTLTLDPAKINANVQMVMNIVKEIIQNLTSTKAFTGLFSAANNFGVLGAILNFVSPQLNDLLNGLLQMVVVLMMVISIAAILLIAKMLQWIAEISLDRAAIMKNVGMVMEIIDFILKEVFARNSLGGIFGMMNNYGALQILVRVLLGSQTQQLIDAIFAMVILFISAISVSIVLFIAWLLSKIQEIDLNREKIMTNVDIVMKTLDFILSEVFARNSMGGILGMMNNYGALQVLVRVLLGAEAQQLIDALFSLIILFLSALSVSIILWIAHMLHAIQEIRLDRDMVMNNVELVMDTINYIIEAVFADAGWVDIFSGGGRKLSVFKILVQEYLGGEIAKLIDAILSVLILALAAISVSIILFIADKLKTLQDMNLDAEDITKKVSLVLETINYIINEVFADAGWDSAFSQKGNRKFSIFRGFVQTVLGGEINKILDALLAVVVLALSALSISIVLWIADKLRELQDIPLDPEKITANVDTVFDTLGHVMDRVFEDTMDPVKNFKAGGLIGDLMGFLAPGINEIWNQMIMVRLLALSELAISVVKHIAELLKEIQDIELDKDEIVKNINTIFDVVELIMDKVFSEIMEPKGYEGDIFTNLISFFDPEYKAITASLKAIQSLQLIYTAIKAIANIAENLQTIGSIDSSIMTAAEKNVNSIMDCAKKIMEEIYNMPWNKPEAADSEESKFMKWLMKGWDGYSGYEDVVTQVRKFSQVATAISAIANIAENLDKVGKFDTDVEAAKKKAKDVMLAAKEIVEFVVNGQADPILPKIEEASYEEEGWMHAVWRWFKGESEQEYQLEKKIGKIGVILTAMQSITGIVDSMQKINDAVVKGTVSAEKVAENAKAIISAGASVFKYVATYGNASGQELENRKEWFKEDPGWIGIAVNILKQVQTLANQFAATSIEMDIETISSNIIGLLDKVLNVIFKIQSVGNGIWDITHNDLIGNVNVSRHAEFSEINKSMDSMVYFFSETGPIQTILSQLKLVAEKILAIPEVDDAVASRTLNIIQFIQDRLVGLNNMKVNIASLMLRISLVNQLMNIIKNFELKADDKMIDNGQKFANNLIKAINTINTSNWDVDAVLKKLGLLIRLNDLMNNYTGVSTEAVKNSKDFTENYIKFLDKVDTMDLKKLETTEQLMKHMAVMTLRLNGNFKALAEAINEHIAPMLETLNESMNNCNQCQKEIMDELTKPIKIDVQGALGSSPSMPSDGGGAGPVNTGGGADELNDGGGTAAAPSSPTTIGGSTPTNTKNGSGPGSSSGSYALDNSGGGFADNHPEYHGWAEQGSRETYNYDDPYNNYYDSNNNLANYEWDGYEAPYSEPTYEPPTRQGLSTGRRSFNSSSNKKINEGDVVNLKVKVLKVDQA